MLHGSLKFIRNHFLRVKKCDGPAVSGLGQAGLTPHGRIEDGCSRTPHTYTLLLTFRTWESRKGWNPAQRDGILQLNIPPQYVRYPDVPGQPVSVVEHEALYLLGSGG